VSLGPICDVATTTTTGTGAGCKGPGVQGALNPKSPSGCGTGARCTFQSLKGHGAGAGPGDIMIAGNASYCATLGGACDHSCSTDPAGFPFDDAVDGAWANSARPVPL
jgi:hypothetical protein